MSRRCGAILRARMAAKVVVVVVAAVWSPVEVRCEAHVCCKKHGHQFTGSGNKRALGPRQRRRGPSRAQLFAPLNLPLPLNFLFLLSRTSIFHSSPTPQHLRARNTLSTHSAHTRLLTKTSTRHKRGCCPSQCSCLTAVLSLTCELSGSYGQERWRWVRDSIGLKASPAPLAIVGECVP